MYNKQHINYVGILHTTVTNLSSLGLPNVTIKLQEKNDTNQFITPLSFINEHDSDHVYMQYVSDERDLSKDYHNELHCSMVANLAMFIAAKEYTQLKTKPTINITQVCMVAVLAGVFHDAGHSLGKHSDRTNIDNAKQIYTSTVGDRLNGIIDGANDLVLEAIDKTIFPREHVCKRPLKTIDEVIYNSLVDADSLYTLLHKNPLTVINALYKERGLNPTNEQLVKDQVDYYTNLTLYTSTGEYLLEKYLPPHLKNITLK